MQESKRHPRLMVLVTAKFEVKCGEAIVDGNRHGAYLISFRAEDMDNLSAD